MCLGIQKYCINSLTCPIIILFLVLFVERTDDVAPTVGFDSKKITVRGHEITLFDLGGGPKIRGML